MPSRKGTRLASRTTSLVAPEVLDKNRTPITLEVFVPNEVSLPASATEAALARVKVAEAWANMIGWKLFGILSLGLMVAELQFGVPPVLPAWALLALGGAGLGGRELADVILSLFSGLGDTARSAQQRPQLPDRSMH